MSDSDNPVEEGQPRTKVGAPNKREKAVVAVADAFNLILSPEILSLADMEKFPQLQDECPKNQLIMCGVACGFRQTDIASSLGITRQAVHQIVNRIDPNGMFKVSKDAQNAFITQQLTGIGMTSLQHITEAKLEEASAKDLVNIADKALDARAKLNQSKHREAPSDKLDIMLNQALSQMDVAEVEEDK